MRREGFDVHSEVVLPVWSAILGVVLPWSRAIRGHALTERCDCLSIPAGELSDCVCASLSALPMSRKILGYAGGLANMRAMQRTCCGKQGTFRTVLMCLAVVQAPSMVMC